jgi:iron complex outermembrane recepter protein
LNPSRSIQADVGGRGLANFRIGFRSGDTWDVSGWIRNALDKNFYQELDAATDGNTGLIVGIPGDPRTWGLILCARFW